MMRFCFVIGFFLLLTACAPKTEVQQTSDDPAAALVIRIVKDKADLFEIEYIEREGDKDVFELETKGKKVILRGNNGVSIASALNHYLKHFCHVDISWNSASIVLPEEMPQVATKIRKVSPYKHRYYLNYCTFNYSMAWWDWERWQKEIDWMALNGINMPLALTGEEAIWQDVYKQLGFDDADLGSFFTGPAYFSWLWMGNIDGWGGPLPQHWIDTHRALQKDIVARERSLGMTTVLPAFTGHVPPSFSKRFPNAKLKKTNWGAGFDDVYILDASDSLFARIGAMFIETQTEQYGTDHFYSADTFNENVPPQRDSTFLSNISNKVYQSMATTDPDAVWVMQGWMFHYNDEFWHQEQIKALLAGVPDDHMMILDLYSESHPVWNKTGAYYGKPWIWNMLQNFGGNISLFGRMDEVAKGPSAALQDPHSGKLNGIGLTPEGIEQNPALFALMLENVWQNTPVNIDDWLKEYAHRRYGKESKTIDSAWSILRSTVYTGGLTEGGPESIIVARPTLSLTGHRVLTSLPYENHELAKAWKLFIEASRDFEGHDGFGYDLVDISRQVLANYASPLQQKIAKACKVKDLTALRQYKAEFLSLIGDMDMLLATRREFLLDKWLRDARACGITKEESDLYEFNARALVTLWGNKDSELHEYSNRQWSGLLNDFYKPRWQKFFDYIEGRVQRNEAIDEAAFEKSIKDWEWNWVNIKGNDYKAVPSGSSIEVARYLYDKYHERIEIPVRNSGAAK